MKDSKYFRDLGWAQLQGRWSAPAIFTLVEMVICIVVGSVGGGLLSLFALPMEYSYRIAFLDNKRTGADFKVEKLFDGYKDFLRIFGTLLLQGVYIILWSLLLFVPGVIKSISYSQTNYILKDNPELSFNAAIERSMAMMEGHKMQYFLLNLSFIGWMLLGSLCFGVGTLWATAYMSTANAVFYEELIANDTSYVAD